MSFIINISRRVSVQTEKSHSKLFSRGRIINQIFLGDATGLWGQKKMKIYVHSLTETTAFLKLETYLEIELQFRLCIHNRY